MYKNVSCLKCVSVVVDIIKLGDDKVVGPVSLGGPR